MSLHHTLKLTLLAATACIGLMGAVPSAALAQPSDVATSDTHALPADSLYWLSVPLTDARGEQFELRDLAGHPVLITMFYGDCNTACPVVLESLQQTMKALKPAAGRLSVLMVSLDPLHDSPASLAHLEASHHLDQSSFRLAVGKDEPHTRAMAAALNIKYRVLGGGEISHSTRVCLLDADGKIVASSTQLSAAPDQEFLKKIRLALK